MSFKRIIFFLITFIFSWGAQAISTGYAEQKNYAQAGLNGSSYRDAHLSRAFSGALTTGCQSGYKAVFYGYDTHSTLLAWWRMACNTCRQLTESIQYKLAV